MSLKRYDAKRDKNEPEITKALRDIGADVVLLSLTDVPDILCGYKNRTFLLEVKT
jgi:Holliday junction resolvase